MADNTPAPTPDRLSCKPLRCPQARTPQPPRVAKWVVPLLAVAALAGTGVAISVSQANSADDAYAYLPASLNVNATVRDFKHKGSSGGHDDFETGICNLRVGALNTALDSQGKPTANNLQGKAISKHWKDKSGRQINPALYNASLGDVAGSYASNNSSYCFKSAASFAQWYRDVSGVNVSKNVPLVLNRVAGTNKYVMDSATDEPWKSKSGFFPINGELFGNYSSTGKNFHFTTEVETSFIFEKGKGQIFKFTGDDDVWVFIDGQLVIDLGGIHGKVEQYLELDRLAWLEDGKQYMLKIFHAERHTTESNWRIETTLKLSPAPLPATTALYD
ncbi:MAG: fibro-slime domain-containing protein [Phycisphaerales bacterium]